MTGRVVVIGVGNDMRRDDGAGLAVLRRARVELPEGVEAIERDGEPTRLLDTWAHADLAVVVDAIRSGAAPGTIHRFDLTAGDTVPEASAVNSSHALGIGDSVALARALDLLPARLVVLGIEGAEFDDGPGLSTEVEAAVGDAARRILTEITSQRGDVG